MPVPSEEVLRKGLSLGQVSDGSLVGPFSHSPLGWGAIIDGRTSKKRPSDGWKTHAAGQVLTNLKQTSIPGGGDDDPSSSHSPVLETTATTVKDDDPSSPQSPVLETTPKRRSGKPRIKKSKPRDQSRERHLPSANSQPLDIQPDHNWFMRDIYTGIRGERPSGNA